MTRAKGYPVVAAETVERGVAPPLRLVVLTLFRMVRLRPLFERVFVGDIRRRLIPLGLLEGYRDFERLGTIPRGNFVDDFTLYQAAELLGTVGTFHGPGALDEVISELRETFDEVAFRPEGIHRLDDDRLIFVVRFSATGHGSGVAVDKPIAHFWSMRGLRALRLEVYWEPEEALAAAGVHEERKAAAPFPS